MAQTSTYKINVTEKGAKKAKKNINGLNNSLGGLAKKAGLAAAGFFGARMLLDGLKQAINLSAQQELAEKKLESALGRTSQALLDQASALQQQTAFGDEAIIEAQALIAAFTDEEETIKAATQATVDLAAAKGMDLVAAADLVSKSLGSSTNALSRYGIEVTGAVGSTERLETLTTNVGNLFGGQAADQADTMSGALDQMKNAIGDAAENLGDLLGPTIISMAKGFKGAAEAVGAFLDSLKKVDLGEAIHEGDLENVNKALKQARDEADEWSNTEITFNPVGWEILQDNIMMLQSRQRILSEMSESERAIFLEEEAREQDRRARLEKDIEDNKQNSTDLIKRNETEADSFKKLEFTKISERKKSYKIMTDLEKDLYGEQLKNQALGAASAREGMLNVVRAEIMKATSGYIAGLFTSLPPYVALPLAAGAGGLMNETISTLLNQLPNPTLRSFASGGSFVTSGAETIMVGDNPSGREIVSVTPLDAAGQPTTGGMITVNISGNVMSENYTEDVIVPHIKEALRRGEDIGIG